MVKSHRNPNKRPVTVFLDKKAFDKLTRLCADRGISRADFLRGAVEVADRVPSMKTRPLTGICLERHKKRLRREKAAARRAAKMEG